jgi:hypothetical protein
LASIASLTVLLQRTALVSTASSARKRSNVSDAMKDRNSSSGTSLRGFMQRMSLITTGASSR